MFNLIKTGINFMMGDGGEYMFPGGRILKVVNMTRTATESSNPLVIAGNLTLTVVDCCCPPSIKLAAHCVAATSLIAASVVSPTPVTVGAALHLFGEIYENC